MHQADLKHSNKTLQDKLEKIFQLRRTRSKVNWDRTQYLDLLEKFGNPHKNLPPVIHVAGTNGKGSVIAFLRSMLEAQGYKVHAYTSPHLIDVNERIVLAGEPIDNQYLETLLDQALEYNQDAPLSFFEITTAAAFKAFSETPADVLLLEVGMGGRLDCTNVIEKPIATVINRVSMNHTEFLGDDIAGIAREKAGIMKDGVPCIIGHQTPEVMEVLKQCGDDLLCYIDHWDADRNGDKMIFECMGPPESFPLPALTGEHQIQNAGLALATLYAVKDELPVSKQAMDRGLQTVRWAGRLQKIPSSAFGVPEETDIWIDCGHNDSAAEALADQIQDWKKQDDKPVSLVVGMLLSKDPAKFLSPLIPHIKNIHIVPIASDPSTHDKASLEQALELDQFAVTIYEHGNVKDAILATRPPTRLLIAGSAYLAGEVLSHL